MYVYIYIVYMYMCVCICICMYIFIFVYLSSVKNLFLYLKSSLASFIARFLFLYNPLNICLYNISLSSKDTSIFIFTFISKENCNSTFSCL